MLRVITVLASIALAACAPSLPETGTPSPFDGIWTGQAEPERSECYKFTVHTEVKFGQMVGEIRDGAKLADVWGAINPDGTLDGKIGVAGVEAASASIQLDAETGTGSGTYQSDQCDGALTLTRQ